MLSFFRAPPGYTVVFTANATGALKLVGESFPFSEDSCFVLGTDSHNSVHGIRQFALQKGAKVHYIDSTDCGGMDTSDAKVRTSLNAKYNHILISLSYRLFSDAISQRTSTRRRPSSL